MRYAIRIIGQEGMRLLHGLVALFIGVFSLHLHLLWPIRMHLDGSKFLDTVKGKICMGQNLTNLSSSSNENFDYIDLSIKPKLIIISISLIFLAGVHHFYWSAIRAR